MLEPVLRPRTGQALNAAAAIGFFGAIFLSNGVTSYAGFVPALVAMPPFALGFGLRAGGVTHGIVTGRDMMPWAWRVASWIAFAVGFLVLGLLLEPVGLLAFGGVVALDAAGALSTRRPDGVRVERASSRRLWTRAAITALVVVYAAGFVVLHLFYAQTIAGGPLVDWAYLVAGFAVLLRFAPVGRRAKDAEAAPPPAHRAHVGGEASVPDPLARDAAEAANAFLKDGDAGPLLEVARATARQSGGGDAAVARVEAQVLAALARAGTSRADDLEAAVAALERSLTLRPPSDNR